ncbi:MAG: BolA family protein [Methylocystis sp.]
MPCPIRDRIEQKISLALKPVRLSVIDESRQHAGHGNHHPDGETHFRIEIVSDAFAGLNRLARHRLVNSILAEELAGRIHALAMTTLAPDERS